MGGGVFLFSFFLQAVVGAKAVNMHAISSEVLLQLAAAFMKWLEHVRSSEVSIRLRVLFGHWVDLDIWKYKRKNIFKGQWEHLWSIPMTCRSIPVRTQIYMYIYVLNDFLHRPV